MGGVEHASSDGGRYVGVQCLWGGEERACSSEIKGTGQSSEDKACILAARIKAGIVWDALGRGRQTQVSFGALGCWGRQGSANMGCSWLMDNGGHRCSERGETKTGIVDTKVMFP